MSEAVKTRRISIHFKPRTPARVISTIKKQFSNYVDDDDELVDYFKTDLHKEISASMTPGDKLRELRLATGMTLKAVGEKIEVTAYRVSDYEHGRREISKAIAKKLGEAFGVSPAVFI